MTVPEPEMPRPLSIQHIPAGGMTVDVVASPAECAALALRMGLPAIHRLVCVFRLDPLPGGVFAAEGALRARVTQECVVSLEPFDSDVTDDFSVRFVPEGEESEEDDPEAPDELPYSGIVIDLGEAAAEQLALALDPYPRAPGAVLPGEGEGEASGPFAALARLRRPQ